MPLPLLGEHKLNRCAASTQVFHSVETPVSDFSPTVSISPVKVPQIARGISSEELERLVNHGSTLLFFLASNLD